MMSPHTNLNPRRRTSRLATCIMTLTAAVAAAHAQTPPYAEFQ